MTFDLASLGWDADFARAYTDLAGGSVACLPARVARVDRGVCTVFIPGRAVREGVHPTGAQATGTDRASLGGGLLVRCGRDPAALPCPGDWVVVRTWPDRRRTIEAVLPRRTRIVRSTAGRQARGQVLASNLDVVAVVEPLAPAPDPTRIERLLGLAISSGARPLVVLTKADLLARPDAVAREIAELTGGVEVITVSARRGTGLERLRPLVAPGRTLGLLGPPESGRSTVINALAGATVMATQPIRRVDAGRSDVSGSAPLASGGGPDGSLIPLPGGGAVLDAPAVREVGRSDPGTGPNRVVEGGRGTGHRGPGGRVRNPVAGPERGTTRGSPGRALARLGRGMFVAEQLFERG